MRWRGGRRSANVEDRRGMGGLAVGGGVGGVVLLVLVLLLGGDPGAVLEAGPEEGGRPATAAEDSLGEFSAVVLGYTEDVWNDLFARAGQAYPEPTLVRFSGAVQSACGMAGSAVGPFYCPADGRVYIDLAFFRELRDRFGAPGDFAQAYVIAHEVGHHVQNVLGTSGEVERARRGLPGAEANRLSVMLELQADCYAGVWGYHARELRTPDGHPLLEAGDLEEALGAAAAIGDDRLQAQAQGHVVPESFTHGSSAERARWFRRGFETGDPARCDTFEAGA